MLRRKFKKSDNHSNDGSFSYSKVESAASSDSTRDGLQEENVVLSNSVDVDVDLDEKSGSSWSADDKKIFEDQLESLQEQLIASMMENQKLGWYI